MNRTKLYKAMLLILFTPVVVYTNIAKGNDCAVSNDSVLCGKGTDSRVKEGIAIGNGALVNDGSATDSIALGNNAIVNGAFSSALGAHTTIDPGVTNSVALGDHSVASEDNVVSIGSSDRKRKIVYLDRGDYSSKDSTDAVNGGQLYEVNQVAEGNNKTIQNSGIDLIKLSKNNKTIFVNGANKDVTAFNFENKNITGVKDGVLGQSSTDAVNGGQLHNVDKMAKTNKDTISASGVSLIKFSEDKNNKTIFVNGANKDVTAFNFENKNITGVKDGVLGQSSTDAVNGGQLHNVDKMAKTNKDTISASGVSLIKFSEDKNNKTIFVDGANKDVTAFNFENKNITGVKDGVLGQSSTDAVNGGQLYNVDKKAEKNATEIKNMMGKTGVGLVKLSDDQKTVVFSDYVKDATIFNVGDRKITGAKQGELNQSSTDVVTGSQLHATNKQVEMNTDNIADHTSKIANNTHQLADHTSKIANNTSQLADHTSKITNNTGRIDSLENKMRSVDSELGRMDKKIDRGLAMSAAMNGLFQPYGVGNINMSVAFGGYGDHQAVAVGSGYRVNENVAFKAGVSTTGSSKTMYNAGVNIEW